jgi:hypothetical protein
VAGAVAEAGAAQEAALINVDHAIANRYWRGTPMQPHGWAGMS